MLESENNVEKCGEKGGFCCFGEVTSAMMV